MDKALLQIAACVLAFGCTLVTILPFYKIADIMIGDEDKYYNPIRFMGFLFFYFADVVIVFSGSLYYFLSLFGDQ
jgi:hypothetical protein